MISKFALLSTVSCMLMHMPPTDPYETTCFQAPGYLYEFGCPYAEWPNATCLCGIDTFISTVVNCIDRLTTNMSADLNTSLAALAGTCEMTLDELTPFVANSSSLPSYSGNYSGKPGTWFAPEAFALQDKEIWNAYQVTIKGDRQENFSKRYGVALVAYWVGLALVDSAAHFAKWLFPLQWMRLRRLTRQIPPVPAWIHIAVFLIFSAVFAFIQLGNHSPNYTSRYSFAGAFGACIGKRSGVMSLYLIPLLVLFAGRNNFLLWITNWSQSRYLLYHRWIARVTVALVLAHAIGYSIERSSAGRYGSMWSQRYWRIGIVGLAFGMFAVVQGCRFLRYRAYDLFIIIHIVVAIVFLAAGYWHMKTLGEPLGFYFFYTAFAVWGFDRACRLLRVVSSGIRSNNSPGISGITGSRRTWSFGVPALVELEHNALVVTFDRPLTWNLICAPGQHIYVHFLVGFLFWQSHPFTIVSSMSEPNKIKLFVRVHKGITKKLADMVLEKGHILEKDRSVSALETRILLDGPYGHSHDLFEFDELVFIAGGTGITASYPYIQSSITKFANGFQKITLFWAVSTSLEKWFDKELQVFADMKNVDVRLFFTRDSETPLKMDIEKEVGTRLSEITGPTAVLCCGPGSMNAEAHKTVAKFARHSPFYVEFFDEAFSM